MSGDRRLRTAASQVVECLARDGLELVLAESCTGGLVAATLAGVPGVSAWLCGSAVVYQTATKSAWLGVPRKLLEECGPVSRQTAAAMAIGGLKKTPRARIAAAITGHLGPDAPAGLDGVLYLAIARRAGRRSRPAIKRLNLANGSARTPAQRLRLRMKRQQAAAIGLLEFLLLDMQSQSSRRP